MADGKISAWFSCQRCLQAINFDDSFNTIGEHVLAELALPIHSKVDVDLSFQSTSLDTYVNPYRISDSGNGTNGFMLVSSTGEPDTLSTQIHLRKALLDTLSETSSLDHPLCEECAESILEILDQELKQVQSDYDDYSQYLNSLENNPQDVRVDELEKELEDLLNEEKRLFEELEALKLEEAITRNKIKEQKKVELDLMKTDSNFWLEFTKLRREIIVIDDDYTSLQRSIEYTTHTLKRFQSTNVLNATFHIWYSDQFGTINKFRVGRLPTHPVDWSEINAGWGQIALLISALARKTNYTFEKYRLVPYGNYSYLEVLADHRELPLHSSGGFRYFWDTKYDSGMLALVECLLQLQDYFKILPNFLPYRLSGNGKIADQGTESSFSIKIQLNSEEQWTKALKFLLTNIKWIVAWASNPDNMKRFETTSNESNESAKTKDC